MAFLPFYLPRSNPLNVVIIGGGYAGMAALVSLHRFAPTAQVTIVDPGLEHLKVTHLHETFRRPLAPLRIPFETLARRFGCRHIQADVEPSECNLLEWWGNRGLVLGDEYLGFDALLVTCGISSPRREPPPDVFDLGSFAANEGSAIAEAVASKGPGWLTVVGGGATGVQFLFELANYVRQRHLPLKLRLVDGEDAVLKQFAAPLGQYVQARMADMGIEYLPETFFQSQEGGAVTLQKVASSELFSLPSTASFLFLGKTPPHRLTTNIFGQVTIGNATLEGVFAAGDCARYRGPGSNTYTAQAAVRKGKLAARNILRATGRLRILEPYLHRDMGYVISLGPDDAVGWLALERNIVAGYPALVVKELVEAQYDLLMAGIDTYIL
ncbi:NAD(P)/FAD-dependent oxidoreductase [Methylotetracoccus oryzae]|uniref:NAD(P)/FAD-dependent oxidoreductase n=1 Tax=Methylotetracoccus oryzae TaxID=1919059 RepID=UPI00111A0617|nr:FAD-dependent oxidoreductase [Methylotetracoccus oryzae]